MAPAVAFQHHEPLVTMIEVVPIGTSVSIPRKVSPTTLENLKPVKLPDDET